LGHRYNLARFSQAAPISDFSLRRHDAWLGEAQHQEKFGPAGETACPAEQHSRNQRKQWRFT
jgi:hypothetical protein